MNVILLERVGRLGGLGDEVNVKPGFARNFLIPQGKAVRASKANRDVFEARRSGARAGSGRAAGSCKRARNRACGHGGHHRCQSGR